MSTAKATNQKTMISNLKMMTLKNLKYLTLPSTSFFFWLWVHTRLIYRDRLSVCLVANKILEHPDPALRKVAIVLGLPRT